MTMNTLEPVSGFRVVNFSTRFRHLVFVIVFLAGLGVMGLIPPLQSPDEPAHLTRAYMLSTGQLTLLTPPGRSSGGYIDPALQQFYDIYQRFGFDPSQKVNAADIVSSHRLRWTKQRVFSETPGTGYYLPFIYLPQALSIAVGRIFRLSVASTYILTRFVTFICAITIITLAFRFTAPNEAVFALIALPMTVFQLVSSSIDGLALALTVLLLSIFSQSVRTRVLSRFGLLLSISSMILVTTSRPHMLPLLMLPFIIIRITRNRWGLPVTICAAVCVIAWLTYAAHSVIDIRIVRDAGTADGLKYYALRPQKFIQILYMTMIDSSLMTYYRDSFIGMLGWLDTRYPDKIIQIIWGFLLAQIPLSIRLTRKSIPLTIALCAIAAISSLLVFLLLLVAWTGPKSVTIQGVQGRYFILPALVAVYGLTTLDAESDNRPAWVRLAAFAALFVLIMTVIFTLPSVLLDRYFS